MRIISIHRGLVNLAQNSFERSAKLKLLYNDWESFKKGLGCKIKEHFSRFSYSRPLSA
jgi:hypothetical protein